MFSWLNAYAKNFAYLIATLSRPYRYIVITASETANSMKLVSFDAQNRDRAHRVIQGDLNHREFLAPAVTYIELATTFGLKSFGLCPISINIFLPF